MNNRQDRKWFLVILTLALLAAPVGMRAQEEEEEGEAQEPAVTTVENAQLAIELGAPFRDNAVLQREMKVPVWGWSAPGTTVTVEFAGQKKSAVAGEDGTPSSPNGSAVARWMLELDPLKASFEPAEMVIQESGVSGQKSGKKVVLKNILVGEVWFASGQSNMQWPASQCDVGLLQNQIAERVAAGKEKQPVIREAKITDRFAALHPIERANAAWSEEAITMSAIAYSFAYHVFREIDAPIGILNCSFSQTSIQAWTPRIGFRDGTDEYTKAIYQKILQTDPNTPEHKAAWEKFYADAESDLKAGRRLSVKRPGNLDGNRDASWMFNARLNPMIPYAVRGGIWNQGYANMGEGLVYYNNLHSMIRGWRLCWNKPDMPVYFNQFYCPGRSEAPSIGGVAEMRLGTWLARDIPHVGMASQIDITGAVHYANKTIGGQRLALHALKNDYGMKVIADGPMFKSYRVDGDKVIVELEHAEGGLVVAETGSNSAKGLAVPKVIPDGAPQVKHFYLAGEDRVWWPAEVKIDGSKLVVTSAKVQAPRGVTYGMGGIGNRPNIYNHSLIPLTPFIYYDNKLVTSENWPGGQIQVGGAEEVDPLAAIKYVYRKMPLLSSQFVNNAVLQAGQPVIIWGAAVEDDAKEVKGKAEIAFSFAGIEKTIPVTPDMREWQVALPPMAASAEPKTLKVAFSIDGQVVHERVCTNIVLGDVWFVAAPSAKFSLPEVKATGIVRMMGRKTKGDRVGNPRRYSVSVSTGPENRFASRWENAGGYAAALGNSIAAKTGKPVGIVFMQSASPQINKKNPRKSVPAPQLKHWFPAECLDQAPSLMSDYETLASVRPGNKYYEASLRQYLNDWKKYWGEYIPALMNTKAVPDGRAWGSYPGLGSVNSDASQCYNVMVSSFTPGNFKGVIFLASPYMVEADQGALFGEQMTALANCWKAKFACEDPAFIYTIPSKALAAKITPPSGIKGNVKAVEVNDWSEAGAVIEAAVEASLAGASE